MPPPLVIRVSLPFQNPQAANVMAIVTAPKHPATTQLGLSVIDSYDSSWKSSSSASLLVTARKVSVVNSGHCAEYVCCVEC